jgi:hypothetical protein
MSKVSTSSSEVNLEQCIGTEDTKRIKISAILEKNDCQDLVSKNLFFVRP